MFMYHVDACCLQRSEEGVRSPGTGGTDDSKATLVPRAKSRSSARATDVLNHWIISSNQ